VNKPLIAIDIDDVISETTEAIRVWSNTASGVELSSHQFNQTAGEYWGYYERVWNNHGISLNFNDFETSMAEDMIEVPLLADASFALHEILESYNVVLITSRITALRGHTERWFEKHFPGNNISLHFASNPKSGENRLTKGQICKQLGASLLIDDNPEHCASMLQEGLEAILFGDYGWQQAVPEGAVRCKRWPDVLEYLNGRQQLS